MLPDTRETSPTKVLTGGDEAAPPGGAGATPGAAVLLDSAGYVLSCNCQAEQLLHASEANLRGEHYSRFFFRPEEVRRGEPEYELHATLAEGAVAVARWFTRPDGTAFWGVGSTKAIRHPSGRVIGFAVLLRDDTAAKVGAGASSGKPAFPHPLQATV